MTIFSWIVVCCLLVGWYTFPTLLQDAAVWCKAAVNNTIAYFKK